MGITRPAMGQGCTSPLIYRRWLLAGLRDRLFDTGLLNDFIDQPVYQNFARVIFCDINAEIPGTKTIGRNKGKDGGCAFRAKLAGNIADFFILIGKTYRYRDKALFSCFLSISACQVTRIFGFCFGGAAGQIICPYNLSSPLPER